MGISLVPDYYEPAIDDNNNKQRLIEYLTNQLTEKDYKNK
jgi:hypothetical protein